MLFAFDAEAAFRAGIGGIVLALEAAAAFIILVAAAKAFARYLLGLASRWRPRGEVPPKTALRLEFGRSLLLALDFAIGSDVLKVAVAPSFQAVAIVAGVVVVRVVLTFVLEHELDKAGRQADAGETDLPHTSSTRASSRPPA